METTGLLALDCLFNGIFLIDGTHCQCTPAIMAVVELLLGWKQRTHNCTISAA